MVDKKGLARLIEENDEAEIDNAISKIFKTSARMKKKMRLFNEFNGVGGYYLLLSENHSYVDMIDKMDNIEMETLYATLQHPVVFADFTSKKLYHFYEDFNGITPVYSLIKKPMDKASKDWIFEKYEKAKSVDTKQDMRYAKIYEMSSKIKKNGVTVLINDENIAPLELLVTELSKLGKDKDRIMDYLSSIKDRDALEFASITKSFSIVDTEKNIVYAIESEKDQSGKETVKLVGHNERKQFENLYTILEAANKNPSLKVFEIGGEDGDYIPSRDAPSDLYR